MGQASTATEANVKEIQQTSAVLDNIQTEMQSIAEINRSISDSVQQSTKRPERLKMQSVRLTMVANKPKSGLNVFQIYQPK